MRRRPEPAGRTRILMDKLIIEGGTPLKGTIDISGSKNAALPILFAGILLDAPMVYTNVPDLRDIHTTIKLLNVLGCSCSYDDHRVELKPGSLLPEAPYDLVRTMRASVLCLGPLLARIGQARVALPGGCAIGARPVDQHLKGLELMGATFELEEGYIMGHCDKLRGAHITFDMPTVGGTENLLMAAVLADGETTLENAAREPEVVDLANFLISCGAQIEGHGSSTIRIKGVSSLRGTEYAIMADRIEAGTFLVAAGITGGELLLKNCPFTELESVIAKLESMGLAIEQRPEGVLARYQGVLRGADVKTRPYPGFPTDMQAQIMALFRHLRQGHDFTFLFIAHDLAMVRYLCDRVGVMRHGRLVELAPTKELFARPLHAYTRALLSAMPVPDPLFEQRKEILPCPDDESDGTWREVHPGHWLRG